MGIHDSSLTRVQPAFNALGTHGAGWLERLLVLGSRASAVGLPPGAHWAGAPLRSPVFEHPCTAPMDHLRWLLQHSAELDRRLLGRQAGSTKTKRTGLLNGDPVVLKNALARLARPGGRSHGGGKWHVFEGATMVDCALFFEHVTVFIEGKRTERHLTGRTEWYQHRHQVVRNVDCLRVEPGRADRWYVLTIVEAGTPPEREAAALDDDLPAFRRALPALNQVEVDEARTHYLGFTTWQALAKEFGLPPYPDRVS